MTTSLRPYDETLLRRAFDAAKCARDAGNRPFGAVFADDEGKVLMEQGSGFTSEGGDRTGHAQRLLASRAARHHSLAFLAKCTLYTAAEPCAMCAGCDLLGRHRAHRLRSSGEGAQSAERCARGEPATRPTLRHRLRRRQRPTEVVGPLLESEATALQADFWKARDAHRSSDCFALIRQALPGI